MEQKVKAMKTVERVIWATVLVTLLVLGGNWLWWTTTAPVGPLEPAWDRQACTQCGMLLSDHRFACQLRTPQGETLFFDDPWCLLTYEKTHTKSEAVYFHDFNGSDWLSSTRVAFMEVPGSPMGYRLACVDTRVKNSQSLAWAEKHLDTDSPSRPIASKKSHPKDLL